MFKIIDNIPEPIVGQVEQWVTSTKIPWYYFNHTLGSDPKGMCEVDQDVYQLKDMPRLTHYFYPNSTTAKEDRDYVMPLTTWVRQQLLPGYIVKRVMGNVTTQLPGSENYLNLPHVDSNKDMVTLLYYVNNSDGKTVFFQEKKIQHEVEPRRGRGVLFPSNTVHAGQVPCINKNRYVINIIFSREITNDG